MRVMTTMCYDYVLIQNIEIHIHKYTDTYTRVNTHTMHAPAQTHARVRTSAQAYTSSHTRIPILTHGHMHPA